MREKKKRERMRKIFWPATFQPQKHNFDVN
jgi:hypothetical protein